jgi:hypothetical protein
MLRLKRASCDCLFDLKAPGIALAKQKHPDTEECWGRQI